MKAPKYNPDWYRVKYSIAALHANAEAALKSDAAGLQGEDRDTSLIAATREHDLAMRHARELARTSATTLTELKLSLFRHPILWWRLVRALTKPERQGLSRFLSVTMEPAALVLLAGMLPAPENTRAADESIRSESDLVTALDREAPAPLALVGYVDRLPEHDPRADYNLACLYVSWGRSADAAEPLLRAMRETPEPQRPRLIDRRSTTRRSDSGIRTRVESCGPSWRRCGTP